METIVSFWFLISVLIFSTWITNASNASSESQIELIGTAEIDGDARDLSGSKVFCENGIPQDQLGGFGSAITFTGKNNRYLAVADRGPKDGKLSFLCRFHEFEIKIDPQKNPAVRVTLRHTILLKNEIGQTFTGQSSAYDATNSPAELRLDPEGIAFTSKGTLFISDEYGPFIYEFDRKGRRLRSLPIPSQFLIRTPAASKKKEMALNNSGRRTNKGFEGLTLSSDTMKLYAILQGPLIQDSKICRLLEIDLKNGKSRQFAVELTSPNYGFNEILALSDHEFLVIERDDEKGEKAIFKRIVKIDITGASDIQNLSAVTPDLLKSIKPVKKEPWLDFLESRFNLKGPFFPEKIEGLTWGPRLPDGRRMLVVTTDNDCITSQPSEFWVFAVPDCRQ